MLTTTHPNIHPYDPETPERHHWRILHLLLAAVQNADLGERVVIRLSNRATWFEDALTSLRVYTQQRSPSPDRVVFTSESGGCIIIQYDAKKPPIGHSVLLERESE